MTPLTSGEEVVSGLRVSVKAVGALVVGAMLALSCAGALLLAEAPRALAAGPCVGKVMYVAAHQDDTLLFQSPQLLEDVKANKCVQTVFTTAGDAGKLGEGGKYWKGREAGAEAAYAEMAGVADTWTTSEPTVEGHKLRVRTLNEQTGVTIAYLRLPDGGPDGKGFPLPGGGPSLTKLWRSGHAEMPAISEIEAVDSSTKYTYEGLVKTLRALIESFAPLEIETQNYSVPALVGLDHSDHIVTGKFTQVAQLSYGAAHLLRGYQGYENFVKEKSEMAANVTGALLDEKEDAFFAYTPHDEACGTDEDCEAAPYPEWLERQYVAATESTPGANAGTDQSVPSGASVELDGSGSFDPGGGGLTYAWTQTSGPAVVLSGATAQKPTFTAPTGPATLKFSLKVDSGPRESLPDSITITVEKPTSAPNFTSVDSTEFTTGVFGEFTVTTSGEPTPTVTQTSGKVPPGMTLVGQPGGSALLSGTPEPSAAPPGGSEKYEIGLKAQNSVNSKLQTLTVTVKNPGTAPKFSSGPTASFTTGAAGLFVVTTSGAPAAAITKIAGSLPPGLSLTDNGNGTATISGTPTAAAANPGASQLYPLTLKAKNSVGEVSQELTLTVTSPPAPPPNNGGENPPPKENIVVKLSKAKVKLVVGKKSKHLVKVIAPGKSAVKCRGQLPKGARCKVTAQRDVLIESSKSVKAAGTYHLVIDFSWQQGASQRPLTVVFKRSGR